MKKNILFLLFLVFISNLFGSDELIRLIDQDEPDINLIREKINEGDDANFIDMARSPLNTLIQRFYFFEYDSSKNKNIYKNLEDDARFNKLFDILKLLIEKGADINLPLDMPPISGIFQFIPLEFIINTDGNNLFKLLNYIIDLPDYDSLLDGNRANPFIFFIEFLFNIVQYVDNIKNFPENIISSDKLDKLLDIAKKILTLGKAKNINYINLKNQDGQTAVNRIWINFSFDLNENQLNAIFINFKKCFDFLIENGLDINNKDNFGNSILYRLSTGFFQVDNYESIKSIYYKYLEYLLVNNIDLSVSSHEENNLATELFRNIMDWKTTNLQSYIANNISLKDRVLDFFGSLFYLINYYSTENNKIDYNKKNKFNDNGLIPGFSANEYARAIELIDENESIDQVFLNPLAKDLESLLNKGWFSDQKVKNLSLHKDIFEIRFGKNFSFSNIMTYKDDELNNFVLWAYTGKVRDSKLLEMSCKKLDIKNWEEKSGIEGLKKDFLNAYKNREVMGDFIIDIDGEKIKVHKIILIARSILFRNMFKFTKDKSNTLKYPYEQKPIDPISFRLVLKYFYSLNLTAPKLLDDLNDMDDYYQLTERGLFFDKKINKFEEELRQEFNITAIN